MDLGSVRWEGLRVYGRALQPETDIIRLMMMMIKKKPFTITNTTRN